jgi:heptose-I-phosphate ethanolaminephosphotransferase
VAVVDVFCFVKFQSTLNPTMLLLIGETDSREAGEFLNSYISLDILLSSLSWVFLIIIVHIAKSLFPWWKRFLSSVCMLKFTEVYDKIKSFFIKAMPYLGAFTIVIFIWSAIACAHNKAQIYKIMSRNTIGQVEHDLTEKDKAEMYEPIYRLVFSMYANHLTANQIGILVNVAHKVSVDSCSYRSPNIVLIIGESYNKHHSELYGYDKPTTPRQIQLQKKGHLIPFSDVIAPWNLTSFVFKLVFSTYTVGDSGDWCDYPLFPEIFKKAGYHVTFITNQFLPKAKEELFDFSGGFFLNNPELSKAQFDTRNTKLHVFDEDLLKDYAALKSQNKEHNLTIFHLIGQHVYYHVRCPNSKKHFKGDDYERPDLNNKEKGILSDYDNAVLYNDSVVGEIIRQFENDNTIVIYMPDHGEEVYGPGGVHFFGRMHSTEITARLAREEFEIPFWIWCSHKYIVNHPYIYKQIIESKHKKLMTDALPHMLMYLAGIYSKDYKEQYNILSPKYQENRKRILKNTTDYDMIMKEEKEK